MSAADRVWLDGPVGNTRCIGREFLAELARREQLLLITAATDPAGSRGLLTDFAALSGPEFDAARIHPVP